MYKQQTKHTNQTFCFCSYPMNLSLLEHHCFFLVCACVYLVAAESTSLENTTTETNLGNWKFAIDNIIIINNNNFFFQPVRVHEWRGEQNAAMILHNIR